ncbi:MAG TPA: HD domain-containing protein [Solirubrobacterales bacterium]|jgi:guanosine-3',5'-bis(diphosphate) 3'-pyrophosphohydrolase|nr:HD domain-containing protein [Solirubrobacterales bacterium]
MDLAVDSDPAPDSSDFEREPPEFVFDSDALGLAFFVARSAHAGQTRGGRGRPYLDHPIQVAETLTEHGYPEPTVVAGLLHDVVEDSGLTVGDVVESFGLEVGELVGALTEDPSINDWEERKRALREEVSKAGDQAAAIYAADKLANLHDWRAVYSEVGEDAVNYFKAPTLDARIRAWRDDLAMVKAVAPGAKLAGELRQELRGFEAERDTSSVPSATTR